MADAAMQDDRPTSIWNKGFAMLVIIEIFLQIGGALSRPLVSNFVIGLGAGIAIAGFVVGLSTGTATVLRPVSGFLSDRVNKKTNLTVSATAFTIAAFGCAISDSVFWVALFSVVQGIALSFKGIGMASLVAMSVPSNRIGTAVGGIGLISTLALAVGPALGTLISEVIDIRASFYIAGALCLVGCVISFFYKAPAAAAGKKEELTLEGDGPLIARLARLSFHFPTLPFAVLAVFVMCAHSSMTGLVLSMSTMGYLESGSLYFTSYALAALLSRPVAGRLSDAYGVAAVGVPGLLIAAVGMAELVFFHSWIAVVVSGVLMGLGQAASHSAVQAEAVRGVDSAHLGRATNTYYLGVDIGIASGPFAGGAIIAAFSPEALFVFNTFTLLFAVGMLLVLRKRRQNSQVESD